MIQFKCPSCGKRLKVARHFSGKSGKCRRCKTIVTVPDQHELGISFETASMTLTDADLQRVYSQLIAQAGERIVRHTVRDGIVVIEFRSGDWDERSQVVFIGTVNTNDIGKLLYVSSQIGTIDSPEQAYIALRSTNSLPLLTVYVDNDDDLSIRVLLPLGQTTDEILITQVALVAGAADKLEEQLFGWDIR